jgi:hypothetical protein
MQVIIGVNELQANAMNAVVYPNPANDFIQVEIQGNSNFQYAIYNVVGELVTSDNSLTSLKRLDVSEYPQGLYTLRIVSGTEIQVSKFMVSRR